MGGFSVPSRTPAEPTRRLTLVPDSERLPAGRGYVKVPERLLGPQAGPYGSLPAVAVLVWVAVALADHDDAGVVLTYADLAGRIGRTGTVDSGRKLGPVVTQLVRAGWLTTRRTRQGTLFIARRRITPDAATGAGWYAQVRRDDLDRISRPLDPDPALIGGDITTEADLIAWTRWQTITRRERVRVSLTDAATRLDVSHRVARVLTHRLVRGGWLATETTPGKASTYWLAELDPSCERDLTATPTERGTSPLPNEAHHDATTPAEPGTQPLPGQAHPSALLATLNSLPPKPSAPTPPPPTHRSATGEGRPSRSTPPENSQAGHDRPDDPDAVGRIHAAVAAAWPTTIGSTGISRHRLTDRLASSGALVTHTEAEIITHLTSNTGGVRDALSVVLARLDHLPTPKPRHTPEKPWCGSCDRVSRMVLAGHDNDGGDALARCETCGGGSPAKTARALVLCGGTPLGVDPEPRTSRNAAEHARPACTPLPEGMSRYHWIRSNLARNQTASPAELSTSPSSEGGAPPIGKGAWQ